MRNVKRTPFLVWVCYSAGSLVLVLLIYGFVFEPNQVEVHHAWIRDTKLAELLGRKVVLQLSDLHINEIGTREQQLLKILNELKPDIIFLTGDYVQWEGDNGAALYFLSLLRAKIGIWAVMGDYDYSNSRKSCEFCHEKGNGKPTSRHSVHFLKNSKDDIRLPEGSLLVAGVEGEGNTVFNTKKISFTMNNKPPAIVLSHSPLNFDLIDKDQKVLMLAGDTHGGQVPLPQWLFTVIGYRKNAFYNQGLFEQGQKKMFVSRGIGTSHVPIRLFRRPEVVIFHFQNE